MKYRLVMFDLDGTILNTLQDLTDSVNSVLQKHGFPTHSIDAVRSFVGNGIFTLIQKAVPANTEGEKLNAVFEDFKLHYAAHCADKTKPYTGIAELLLELRRAGALTAVVSNKADFAVKELADRYFHGLFDLAVGEKEGVPRKPAPDSVFAVMRSLGCTATETVYIGDSDVDVATAKNAGLDGIFVTWGFRSAELLRGCGAATLVSTPDEIAKLILN
ncbi:MAG: HAD-IA family hydrolase [Clostridia bacterium]|nr:HAD-IA family hydrolase [Clostridia bacterium]